MACSIASSVTSRMSSTKPQMLARDFALELDHAQPGRGPQVRLDHFERFFAAQPQRRCKSLPPSNLPLCANEMQRNRVRR
jgi:hypothetical protein